MNRRFVSIALMIGALAFLQISCDKGIEADPSFGRIEINEGIEGLPLGAVSATVVQKLGLPDRISIDNAYAYVFEYTHGQYANMILQVYPRNTGAEGLFTVELREPYDGKTVQGIGIGSRRGDALIRLGAPTTTHDVDATTFDYYYGSRATTMFEYFDDKIIHIVIYRTA